MLNSKTDSDINLKIDEHITKEQEPKVEIILSLVIFGHGCEDYLNPFQYESDIANFYKNNVRVFSTAAVPDISCVLGVHQVRGLLEKFTDKFDNFSEVETKEIIDNIKDDMRPIYKSGVLKSQELQLFKDDDRFKRNIEDRYLNQTSNLITYLSNKEFHFYDESEDEIIELPYKKYEQQTIGIHVIDIRLKITDSIGNVTYQQIPFLKTHNLDNFNLIKKIGVEQFLEILFNKANIDTLSLEDAYTILGFKNKNNDDEKLKKISLEELYLFLKLSSINFVNIIDLSCRTCKTGTLNESQIADIGNTEFFTSVSTDKKFGGNKKYNSYKLKKNKKTRKNKHKKIKKYKKSKKFKKY
jgi:hypothetical protein